MIDLRSLAARGHRVIVTGLLVVGCLIAAYALFPNTIDWGVKVGYLGSVVGSSALPSVSGRASGGSS